MAGEIEGSAEMTVIIPMVSEETSVSHEQQKPLPHWLELLLEVLEALY